jgi:hypothetical protein
LPRIVLAANVIMATQAMGSGDGDTICQTDLRAIA